MRLPPVPRAGWQLDVPVTILLVAWPLALPGRLPVDTLTYRALTFRALTVRAPTIHALTIRALTVRALIVRRGITASDRPPETIE